MPLSFRTSVVRQLRTIGVGWSQVSLLHFLRLLHRPLPPLLMDPARSRPDPLGKNRFSSSGTFRFLVNNSVAYIRTALYPLWQPRRTNRRGAPRSARSINHFSISFHTSATAAPATVAGCAFQPELYTNGLLTRTFARSRSG